MVKEEIITLKKLENLDLISEREIIVAPIF